MDVNAPYSQCDAKGRCIRHPTIQMSRRKKLGGGWKKLLGICPMCAMELMQGDGCSNDVGGGGRVSADAYCAGDAASLGPDDRRRREAHRSHRRSSSQHHNGDDGSVDRTVRSAPSTYGHEYDRRHGRHHAPSSHSGGGKRHSSPGDGSDSSCDTTVDMNMSYSSQESRSRGMVAAGREDSGSLSSGGSSGRRRPAGRPQVGHHDRGDDAVAVVGADEGGEFVCGMPYDGMYYTGQVDAASRLPHGLGTLRSDVDGSVAEGEWSLGRLVRDSRAPPPPPPRQDRHHDEEDYDRGYDDRSYSQYEDRREYQGRDGGEYVDYCHPCTSSNSPRQESDLCNSMQQLRFPQDSGSVAETIDDSDGSWSRSSARSRGSRGSSYSARESKGSLPPSSTGARVSRDKVREYAQYVQRCDDQGDWYRDQEEDDDSGISGLSGNSQSSFGPAAAAAAGYSHDGRSRRVRFREDP